MADYGQLVPSGGGDTIYLKQEKLVIGRRESCDIVLRFSNVSGQHARMTLEQGYWFLKDLGSPKWYQGQRLSHQPEKARSRSCDYIRQKQVHD